MTQKPHRKARPHPEAVATGPAWRQWVSNNKRLLAIGSVGVLAASAMFNHAAARRAEADHPPEGSFVEIDGVRIHYVERGTGSPVVLLHGNGVTLQDFTASGVFDLVAASHRVIAFDRPGFGYTDRPRTTVWTPTAQAALLAAALDTLGVSGAVVVGHSWGTLVALAMALDHPAIVSGLVLLSGYYYGTARPDVFPASTPAIPILGDIMAHTVSPLSGALSGPVAIKASFAPAPVSDRIALVPLALALRPAQIRATAADTAMMIPAAIALSRRYPELVMPLAILAGAGDRIVHIANHAEKLAAERPQSILVIVPGQGHLFHYAVPEQVAAAIEEVAVRIRTGGLQTETPKPQIAD